MNWNQAEPRRRDLLDVLARANRTVWEGPSLDANVARATALRHALAAGCTAEQAASALGVHASEVPAVAWTGTHAPVRSLP